MGRSAPSFLNILLNQSRIKAESLPQKKVWLEQDGGGRRAAVALRRRRARLIAQIPIVSAETRWL